MVSDEIMRVLGKFIVGEPGGKSVYLFRPDYQQENTASGF
jgi:hypothetical protein